MNFVTKRFFAIVLITSMFVPANPSKVTDFFKENKAHGTLLVSGIGLGALLTTEALFSKRKRVVIWNLFKSYSSLFKQDSRDYIKERLSGGDWRLVVQVGVCLGLLAEESIYWSARGVKNWLDKRIERIAKEKAEEKAKINFEEGAKKVVVEAFKDKQTELDYIDSQLERRREELKRFQLGVSAMGEDLECLNNKFVENFDIFNKKTTAVVDKQKEIDEGVKKLSGDCIGCIEKLDQLSGVDVKFEIETDYGLKTIEEVINGQKAKLEELNGKFGELGKKVNDSYSKGEKAIADLKKQLAGISNGLVRVGNIGVGVIAGDEKIDYDGDFTSNKIEIAGLSIALGEFEKNGYFVNNLITKHDEIRKRKKEALKKKKEEVVEQ